MATKMYQEVMDQKHTLGTVLSTFGEKSKQICRLIHGKPLFLIGTGASFNACRASKDAFVLHMGAFPQVLFAAEALRYPASCFDGASVIVVSQSGESCETKSLCEKLKGTGAYLIGLTMDPNSTLARSSNEIMFAGVGEEVSSATKTYTAQLLMLYMVACGGDTRFLEMLQSDMAISLDNIDRRTESWGKLIFSQKCGFIAGVGTLEAAAFQAALMLKEKCFLCYEGMSVNELRHGTIETLEPGMNVILMCTGEDGLNEAEIHAKKLEAIGVNVFLVCDRQDSGVVPPEYVLKIENHSYSEFSHIAFAGFGQLMAQRIAFDAGYDVDGFRYLAKIVGGY